MASALVGSDQVYDYECAPCVEDGANKKAAIFCRDCSKHFCLDCSGKHDLLFRKHVKLDRTEVDKWGPPADDLGLCMTHRGEPVILFCREHSALCCHVCVTSDMHRGCSEFQNISVIAQGILHTAKFKAIPDEYKTVQKQLQDAIDIRKQNTVNLNTSRDNIVRDIQNMRQKLHDVLIEMEKAQLKELHNIFDRGTIIINNDIERCRQQVEQIKQLTETTTHQTDAIKAFICYTRVSESFKNAKELTVDIMTGGVLCIKFKPNDEAENIVASIKSYGTIL